DSVKFSGRTHLYRDGKEIGRVPCFAICQNLNESEVLLFCCDSEWNVLGAAGYTSVSEAKARTERVYSGASKCWIDANVTEEQAVACLDEMWGDQRCSFCGKRPDEVEQIFGKASVRICDICVAEFHSALEKDPSGTKEG